jgi:putative hydrolases of HD superfamily
MHEQTAQALLALYSQVATLKLLPRTGWLQRGVVAAESVAEHSFGVAVLALLVGDVAGGLDRGKLLTIALLHDMAEVLLSDLPASATRLLGAEHKHWAERLAMEELFVSTLGRDDYVELWAEYTNGASVEARLVKELDRVEMLVQALAYERSGNRGLAEFWRDADAGWSGEFPIVRAMAEQLIALHNSATSERHQ